MDYLLKLINSIKIFIYRISHDENNIVVDNKEKKKGVVIEDNIGGQYRTIKHLLNELDDVFFDLKKLKPKEATSSVQREMRKYGVFMPFIDYHHNKSEHDDLTSRKELDGHKAYGYPFYIGMYMHKPKGKENEDYLNGFLCAVRSDRLPLRPKRTGFTYYEAYRITIIDGKPCDVTYHVEIEKETGKVTAMPMCYARDIQIKKKKVRKINGKQRESHINHFSRKQWDYPYELKGFMDDSADDFNSFKEYLEECFVIAYNTTMKREYCVNINIKKGKQRITVTVPQHRWKYFFKDRIKAKSISGNTKPIFHAVTAHQRKLKNGISNVKTHYRGLRQFRWGKYDINISMPGKHGISQTIAIEPVYIPEGDYVDEKIYSDPKKYEHILNDLIDGNIDRADAGHKARRIH